MPSASLTFTRRQSLHLTASFTVCIIRAANVGQCVDMTINAHLDKHNLMVLYVDSKVHEHDCPEVARLIPRISCSFLHRATGVTCAVFANISLSTCRIL